MTNSGGHVAPGEVDPFFQSPIGQIQISGNYTQGAGGSLDIDLGGSATPGTSYDQLVVTGAASLAGTLNVDLVNGFAPSMSDTFQVLTFASRTGDFATKNLPATFTAIYRTNDLILGVTVDVSSRVAVKRGGFLYNRTTHHYIQAVTITNNTGAALTGPVSLALDNLTGLTLTNPTGTTTSQSGKAGSPYVNVIAAGGSLAAGASVTIYLDFNNFTGPSISYSTRVLAGSGAR